MIAHGRDHIAAFAAAITETGLTAPESIIADGQLHRFPSHPKRGNVDGWYVLHAGEIHAGAFGCWRLGLTQKWSAVRPEKLSKSDAKKLRDKWRAIQRQHKAERERRHAEAGAIAKEAWQAAQPASAGHAYLKRKRVNPHGLRVDADGQLLAPMAIDGQLVSLQIIDAEGVKRFLPGGRTRGAYCIIGKPTGKLFIAEGFATAASIHEATREAVVVAFNAGNLLPVVKTLREKHPDLPIIVCADNDVRDDGSENTGVAKATEAARAANGRLAVPELDGAKCDFNDLHRERGLDAVRDALQSHYTPSNNRATVQPSPNAAPAEQPKLALSLDILSEFKSAVQLHGLVGENATAQLLYLAITSRLLSKPVSIGVKGHSSSGKSWVVAKVLDFFPDEAVITFTAMSSRALVYRDDDYMHRTIVIYEVTGLRETNEDDMASYLVRTLLSEGRIDYDTTIRGEDGKFTTQRITKEGPTNLIFTTTKTRVHAENETRILSLNTDDGAEQTRSVLAEIAGETERDVDLGAWRQFQAWLQVADQKVTIPYAQALAAAVPPLAVRLRRDFASVLALVRSHAILHQATRERDDTGRIIATIADYAAVRELVIDVISEGIGATVSEVVRETVHAVGALADDGGAMVMDVAKQLRVDKSAASRRIRRAADGGYVRNKEDKRGRPGRWVIGEPLPEAIEVLPQPSTVCTAETRTTPSGCTVDPVQEGINQAGSSSGDAPTDAMQPSTVCTAETRTTPSGCTVDPVQEGIDRGSATGTNGVDSGNGSIPPVDDVQPCNRSGNPASGNGSAGAQPTQPGATDVQPCNREVFEI